MRTAGTKRRGTVAERLFVGLTAMAIAAGLGGCNNEGADSVLETTPAPRAQEEPSTTPPPTHDEFVEACVDYTLPSAYIGDAESLARWNQAEQDEDQLRLDCEAIAEEQPATRAGLEQSKAELDAFFTAEEAKEKREERRLVLEEARKERELRDFYAAAARAEEEEERKLREFYEAAARAEQQRKDDEFFRAVEASNAEQVREAERQGEQLAARSCGNAGGWYRYEINPVRVWLDRCNHWSGGGGGGGGDLNCEDIGEEHQIDPNNDPHNLDGDGDGIACEGW